MNTEFIVGFVLVLILFFFINPFSLFMPSGLVYTLAAALLLIGALFGGLVLREEARDEREEANRTAAGRTGYLTGIAVLVIAIIAETFTMGHPSPWVAGALAGMVVAKLAARAYFESER